MLILRHLRKTFFRHQPPVLDDLSLDVAPGEIYTLLGPSGCGKTTLLRLVAGLETPDDGQIRFGDALWADASTGAFVGPQHRDIGLVFQSYAVWPHLDVFDNVAYPLRNRKLPRPVIRERVLETLASVGLDGFETRRATELSGGQQQRVAMARALVGRPQLLLLDEPFSNLDIELRRKLRLELRELQRRLGLTVLLVTHDQDDAFALSDRIAVLRNGRVEQIGTAEAIHDRPSTGFVHDFVGEASRLRGVVVGFDADGTRIELSGRTIDVPGRVQAGLGDTVTLRVRPGDIGLDPSDGALPGEVTHNVFAGDRYETYIKLPDGQMLMAYQRRDSLLPPGRRAFVQLLANVSVSALEEREHHAN